MKIWKPTNTKQWITLGAISTLAIAGTTVGVTLAVKKPKDVPAKLETPTATGDATTTGDATPAGTKKGKNRELPSKSKDGVDIPTLILELQKTKNLSVTALADALTKFKVKTDVSKGTSYNKVVIGDKYKNMTQFVKEWNKLTTAEQTALNLDTFALMFVVDKGVDNWNIKHQVKSILLAPGKEETKKGRH